MEKKVSLSYWDENPHAELAQAIDAAAFQVDLLLPHSTPSTIFIEQLLSAARRGTLVRILLPIKRAPIDPAASSQNIGSVEPNLLRRLAAEDSPNLLVRTHRQSAAQSYLRIDDGVYLWVPGTQQQLLVKFDISRGSSTINQLLPQYFEDVFLESTSLLASHSRLEHSVKVAELAREVLNRVEHQTASQRGYEFEKLALTFFESIPQFDVMSRASADQGFDILLWNTVNSPKLKAGPLIVEVKAWKQLIDARVVDALAGAAKERGVDTAILFSATGPSKSGRMALRRQAGAGLRIVYLTADDLASMSRPDSLLRQKLEQIEDVE